MSDELAALCRRLFSEKESHENTLDELVDLDDPLKRELATLLIEKLKDEDRFIRVSAMLALERLGPITEEVIPALAQTFSDPHHTVAKMAIRAMGRMGPAVVGHLIKALQYREGRVAENAAQALEAFDTPEAVKALADFRRRSA
ncbi:MAG: hypothetical protein CO113_02260 [Elusimicrobia bacterium CG_4_9_14_3_um_filter_62_55]|nr:MAG: hypothetical protein COR54_03855 [Elusimicrobia bacterium CG22_combo_CG10-13_8_21_14_all_63_91]PJA18505.1 MAG: hypothetical protein COX66_00830 [Elusimicrobia bacterium CG_4_10_14_0_2_um_filter_63_34]PJB26696.1 MAG: hypothetical protein CO113_02260 [Elusimicrobia bacterium CG_4_9_14_3_um_filter_62_55]